MKRFRCGDIVPGCTADFVGSEDEILRDVARHAREDHGMVEVPAPLLQQIREAMSGVRPHP